MWVRCVLSGLSHSSIFDGSFLVQTIFKAVGNSWKGQSQYRRPLIQEAKENDSLPSENGWERGPSTDTAALMLPANTNGNKQQCTDIWSQPFEARSLVDWIEPMNPNLGLTGLVWNRDQERCFCDSFPPWSVPCSRNNLAKRMPLGYVKGI